MEEIRNNYIYLGVVTRVVLTEMVRNTQIIFLIDENVQIDPWCPALSCVSFEHQPKQCLCLPDFTSSAGS